MFFFVIHKLKSLIKQKPLPNYFASGRGYQPQRNGAFKANLIALNLLYHSLYIKTRLIDNVLYPELYPHPFLNQKMSRQAGMGWSGFPFFLFHQRRP